MFEAELKQSLEWIRFEPEGLCVLNAYMYTRHYPSQAIKIALNAEIGPKVLYANSAVASFLLHPRDCMTSHRHQMCTTNIIQIITCYISLSC